jgi:hypothetical protein
VPRTRRFKLGLWIGGVLLLFLVGGVVFNYLDQSSARKISKPPATRIPLGPRKMTPKIVESGRHLVVLAEDGSIWGVGYDDWGQAGGVATNSTEWTTQFQRFSEGSNWVDVAAEPTATIAIRDDGTLWQWGASGGGFCVPKGTGPMQIGTATNWSAVAAAGEAYGLRTDGTLWAWGENLNGELGLATRGLQTNPVPLTTDSDWAMISASGYSGAALKSNGTVWAWGRFNGGSIKDGTLRFLSFQKPLQIGTNSDFVRVQCLSMGLVAEDQHGRLWRCLYAKDKDYSWRRLPDVPNGLSSWSAKGFVVLAVDRSGGAWVLGENHLGVLASRFMRKSDTWLPVNGIADGVVGMVGSECGVLSENGQLMLWGKRVEVHQGRKDDGIARFRTWLRRYLPSLKPNGPVEPSFEVVPWKAAEFVRTNAEAGNLVR